MAGPHASDSDASRTTALAWADRKVIVAITGGVAGYKVATLVSRLVQSDAAVRVLMTDAATRFVGPLTFESLTGQNVITSIWQSPEHRESPHVALARWCDLLIVAPASADIIAKLAAGICDDIVSLVSCALPGTTPVLLAPAMNEQMWSNPVTQRNVSTVKGILGYHCVGPTEGWQACRTNGPGRMSEPQDIEQAARALLGGGGSV